MKKIGWIIFGLVLVLTALSVSAVEAAPTVPPPPWWPPSPPGVGPGPGLGPRCGFNAPPVDGTGGFFMPCDDALRPPPSGLSCFGTRFVYHIVDEQVCFNAPYGGYNYTIRYWAFGKWNTLPTTYTDCEFCADTVPGGTYYSLQGIPFGSGVWGDLFP